MQIHECGASRGLREAVRHANHDPFMKPEKILEILRESFQKGKFIGSGVSEYGRQALTAQQVIRGFTDIKRHIVFFGYSSAAASAAWRSGEEG